jgi:hypothetical protein
MTRHELRPLITDLWNILSDGQMYNPFPHGMKSNAFAELEILLINEGLLRQRRERPSEKAIRESQPTPPESSNS